MVTAGEVLRGLSPRPPPDLSTLRQRLLSWPAVSGGETRRCPQEPRIDWNKHGYSLSAKAASRIAATRCTRAPSRQDVRTKTPDFSLEFQRVAKTLCPQYSSPIAGEVEPGFRLMSLATQEIMASWRLGMSPGALVIRKVLSKRKLSETSPDDDLSYWLSRTPQERIAAVELLRRRCHGSSARLQRVARVFKRKPG